MENLQVVSNMNKMDDIMLPGFRFHPTDEELVGFYLKRKIQFRTLPIELIKQVDIYKYDPWDLPKLACSGEKEWYFYCPRDRKYRNSARPNRVTLAGFWKATGTDRPIYSSNSTECIGLKKSLVFYRGRAAKGIKTDWMMHEFRLPSSVSSTSPPKNAYSKTLPPHDSWAICRIFKKTTTMAQRAFSCSWASRILETKSSDRILNQNAHYNPFSPEPSCSTTETSSPIHLPNDNPIHSNSTASFSTLNLPAYKQIMYPSPVKPFPFPFSTEYLSSLERSKSTIDVDSMLFNISPTLLNDSVAKKSDNVVYEGKEKPTNGVLIDPVVDNNEWGNMGLLGFPLSLSTNMLDMWKDDFIWDSPPCPSDVSASFSTNQCNS